MRSKFPLPVFLAAACLALGAGGASADDAAQTFLQSWVDSINTSPDWHASFSGIATAPDTGRTTLSGLDIESKSPGLSVKFATVALSGFAAAADGGFSASEIDLDGGAVNVGDIIDVALGDTSLTDVSLPSLASFMWTDKRPLAAMIQVLTPVTKVKIGKGTIASMVLTETVESVQSRVTYNGMTLDNWNGTKIADFSIGAITSDSPTDSPLVSMKIDSVASQNIDLDAVMNVFDPSRYAGGVGDLVWHTALGHAEYKGMSVSAPGVTMTIPDVSLDDFKLRQPKGGIDILLNLIPTMGSGHHSQPDVSQIDPVKLLDLTSLYGLGKFAMSDIDVQATGVDKFHLGDVTLSDFALDHVGEFAIDGLDVAVTDQGSVKLGRLAFGGFEMPPLDKVMAAAAAETSGDDVDVSSVLPKLGYVELSGLEGDLNTAPHFAIGHFRMDLGDYVGPAPTSVAVDLSGVDMAVDQLDDPEAQRTFTELGYDRLQMGAGMHLTWSEAGEIAIKEFHMAMQGLGEISGSATLTGLTPADIDHLDADTAMQKLSFAGGSITFKDDSVVGRALDAQARKLKADPAKFREQFAMGLPLMLSFLGDADLQKELAPILQTIVRTSGSITAAATPASAVPLLAIATAAESSPFELFKLLSVDVTGAPGSGAPPITPGPVAPAPADKPATAPAPAN